MYFIFRLYIDIFILESLSRNALMSTCYLYTHVCINLKYKSMSKIAPNKYLCSMLDSQLQASVVGPIFGNNQLELQIPTRGCYNGIHSTNISATPNALWHTESKVFNDNGDTRSGENLLESSISPTLLKSSRESFVKRLAATPISPKHVTNINISNDANNIEQVHNIIDNKEPVVCNHHRSAYTRRRSSMNRPAKYTDNSLSGTLSSTGLSSITDRFIAETGSTSDMNQNKNTKFSNDSTTIGSSLFEDFCTSALTKKEDEFDNSLYFEGMLAPQLDIADVIRAIDEDDEEEEEEKRISYIKISDSESNFISNRQLENRKIFGLNDGTGMSDKLEATILSSVSSLSDKSLSGARLILATRRLSGIMSTRTSIGSWAPSHEISEGNKDNHSSANRYSSPNHLSYTSTKLDDMLSHASSSSSSQMNLVPCSLDDLSNFSGRMSICDNMTFADPRLFGMNEIELIDWQKEAHEWEMEVEM